MAIILPWLSNHQPLVVEDICLLSLYRGQYQVIMRGFGVKNLLSWKIYFHYRICWSMTLYNYVL